MDVVLGSVDEVGQRDVPDVAARGGCGCMVFGAPVGGIRIWYLSEYRLDSNQARN